MQTLINGWMLLFAPRAAWSRIAGNDAGTLQVLLLHTIPHALIPAVVWYYGVTRKGWDVAGEVMKLTPESALPLCVLFFLTMVVAVIGLAIMVQWMSATYGAARPFAQGLRLISYTATPFFLAGLLGLAPILWLDITIGIAVACYCIYLLYIGVSPVMNVTPDRAFLYASAVFAVALVGFVGVLTATVILWDFGVAPEYTY